MKHYLLFLIICVFTSCESESVVFSEINNTMQEPRSETFQPEENYYGVTSTNSTTIINFDYGITAMDGGCEYFVVTTQTVYWDENAYGPDSVTVSGHAVRGYGGPKHNYGGYSNCLVMRAKQEFVPSTSGKSRGEMEGFGMALSIEYPFEAYKSYEIIIKGRFVDINSSIPPTLYCELKNSGIIPVNNPCGTDEFVPLGADYNGVYDLYYKYLRKITPDDGSFGTEASYSRSFSPTESKNALLLSLRPPRGQVTSGAIWVRTVTIKEKTFDPSLNDKERGTIEHVDSDRDDTTTPGGRP